MAKVMISKYLAPQIFLGLFLRKFDIESFEKLAEQLPWRLPEFDGRPQIAQNVPKDAKPDAIRARFMSADGRKVLELAPAKIQFRMLPGEVVEPEGKPNGPKGLKPGTIAESFGSFLPLAMKIHSVFSEHYGATANRIGIMTELFAPLGGSANQRMQNIFLAAGKNYFGERLQELNIQALARPTLGGDRQVNRWLRVKPLRSNDQNNSDMAMGLEVDINTMPDDTYDLTATDVEDFIQNVQKHIEEDIPLLHEGALFEG
jgi:hypothetical protein